MSSLTKIETIMVLSVLDTLKEYVIEQQPSPEKMVAHLSILIQFYEKHLEKRVKIDAILKKGKEG